MSTPPLVINPVEWIRDFGSAPFFFSPGQIALGYSLDSVPPFNLRASPYAEHIHRIDLDEKFHADFIPAPDLQPTPWLNLNMRLAVLFYAPEVQANVTPAYAAHIKFFPVLRWRLGLFNDDEYTFGEWFELQLPFNSVLDDDPNNYEPPADVVINPGHITIVEKNYKSPCGFSHFISQDRRITVLFGDSQFRVEVEVTGWIEVQNFSRTRFVSFEPVQCQVEPEGSGAAECDCCCCGGQSEEGITTFAALGQVEVYAQTDNQGQP